MKKILLTILLIAGLCLAISTFAQIELEQTYPTVPTEPPAAGGPAPVQQTLTGKAGLPDIIKYFINWAIVIAALAVVVSLVIGGIKYLISGAYPQGLADAKKRITNSLLGLVILAGSYLILVTINPQLTVLSLVVQPVDSGVVLFTEAGYNDFTKLTDPELLSSLIRAGQARMLNNDIRDLSEEFGPLVQVKDSQGSAVAIAGKQKVNFANFPLYAIGFWGSAGSFADNVKIKMYNGKNFQKTGLDNKDPAEPNVYGRGKNGSNEPFGKHTSDDDDTIQDNREAVPAGSNPSVQIIWIEQNPRASLRADNTDFFLSVAKYALKDAAEYAEAVKNKQTIPWEERVQVYHPPLSIEIQGTGPGVYLYSDKGGQRYFLGSHEDFGLSDVNFDNTADKIEINNYENDEKFDPNNPDENRPSHNYLAILHDYYHFAGNLRLFFTKVKKAVPLASLYLHSKFKEGQVTLCNSEDNGRGDGCDVSDAGNDAMQNNLELYDRSEMVYKAKDFFWPGNISLIYSSGNKDKEFQSKKVEINNMIDNYGNIKDSNKASSLQIFEIIPPTALTKSFEWESGFETVGGKAEECKEVRLCTEKGTAGDCISYTPGGKIFTGAYNSITLPMPFYVSVNIPKKLTGIAKDSEGNLKKVENKEFARNIKSIYIKGDCLVVLFENSVKDLRRCLQDHPDDCWDGDSPGSHSEIFTDNDWNLADNEIGRCGGRRKLGFGEFKGCASAIAVFPIKIAQD